MNTSVLTVSPPDSGFAPRREFVREIHVSSTFALLAIAGAGFVRLSSFSPQLIAALRQTFDFRQLLRTIREENSLNLVEFGLDGKPWTQSKSTEAEKIFLEILAVIFQHGYTFVSTIDYGREHDDRVSIAFSKPVSPACELVRVPFALSFPSSTVLRVINPPLSSSPAILQAARSAWPRGVVSEKKVSDRCFEFRFKGYGWFQEDTFSADSLQQILSLLNALDRHSFTLITSITLSGNHSRVKDLWIFCGPSQEASSDLALNGWTGESSHSRSPHGSRNTFSPVPTSSLDLKHSSEALHVRSSSLPGNSPGLSYTVADARSAAEPNASPLPHAHSSPNSSVLHKRHLGASPSVQSPLGRSSEEEFPTRRHNLSTTGSVDMTGVGSANQRNFIAARAGGAARTPSPLAVPRSSTESDLLPNHRAVRGSGKRVKTGELFYETCLDVDVEHAVQSLSLEETADEPQLSGYHADLSEYRELSRQLTPRDSVEPPSDVPRSVCDLAESQTKTDSMPRIIGPDAFRDSAFSSATSRSYEIPITWTGVPEDEKGKGRATVGRGQHVESDVSYPKTDEEYIGKSESGLDVTQRRSHRPAMPRFPGSWQPTPIDETPEDRGGPSTEEPKKAAREGTPASKQVDVERVVTPISSDMPDATRKSEAASYGMVSGEAPKGAFKQDVRDSGGNSSLPTARSGGWVLVNVMEGSPDQPSSPVDNAETSNAPSTSGAGLHGRAEISPLYSVSPAARAIAAEDAVLSAPDRPQTSSGLRRFFSGSKFRKTSLDTGFTKVKSSEQARRPSPKERWRKKALLDT